MVCINFFINTQSTTTLGIHNIDNEDIPIIK